MSIFKTPYDTTACNGFVMKKIYEAVEDSVVNGWAKPSSNDHIIQIYHREDVPAFYHPIMVNDKVAIDIRPFVKQDITLEEGYKVTNLIEYSLLMLRGNLTYIWNTERPEVLRDISPFALSAFSSWISENVARRFALDPREQMEVAIIAGIYYQCLFVEADFKFNDTDKLRIGNAVAKSTRFSVEEVFKYTDELDTPINSISAFCDFVATKTNSVRLNDFNVGLLYTILGGSWFATNAKEMVAVALEHPPTWLSLLYSSINERGYKNTGIGKIIDRQGSQPKSLFVQAISRLF